MFTELEALGRGILRELVPDLEIDAQAAIFVLTNAFIASVVDESSQEAFLGGSIFTSRKARERLRRSSAACRAPSSSVVGGESMTPPARSRAARDRPGPVVRHAAGRVLRSLPARRYGDPFTVRLPVDAAGRHVQRPRGDPRDLHRRPRGAARRRGERDPASRSSARTRCSCSTAPRHLRERRLMLPPFHGERMRAYGEVMREVTDRAVDALAGRAAVPAPAERCRRSRST